MGKTQIYKKAFLVKRGESKRPNQKRIKAEGLKDLNIKERLDFFMPEPAEMIRTFYLKKRGRVSTEDFLEVW